MGFDFRPAAAPPPSAGGNYTKLPAFAGKLIVVIPYEKTKSKFKNDAGQDQYQTRSTIIPVQDGSYTDPKTLEETTWKAGDIYDVFVSAVKVQAQTKELGTPVLGRLMKPEKAWELSVPTEADMKLAQEVLADVELPDRKPRAEAKDEGNSVPW